MFQPAKSSLNGNPHGLGDTNSMTRATASKPSLKCRLAVSVGLLLAIMLASGGATLAFGVPTVYKKGTTVKGQGIAPGYVIANLPDGKTYAIDVQGQFAKTWTSPVGGTTTLGYSRPLDNRNLLAFVTNNGTTNQAVEFNQAGALVWQYTDTADRTFHHDLARLPNGNTLVVCSRQVTYLNISPKVLTDDCLLEVDTNGNILFTWQTADHFDEFNFTDSDKVLISNGAGDWAHMNSAEVIPGNDYHDARFKPGNFIVSYRYLDLVIIVDPSTGSIVWRADNITIGQHDATMIKTGLPGAGNIMIFDNGQNNVSNHPGVVPGRLNSRVVELNPLDLSIVNSYDATLSGFPIWMFLGSFVGSAQRLPNGNLLIDEGPDGRIFEVTATGTLVWEWVNGVTNATTKSTLVYRAEKVPLSWLQP